MIDLGARENASLLGLSPDDLVKDWAQSEADSPTQGIGQQALIDGLEAFLFPSRVRPAQRNLAVFRDNLLATSRLDVVHEDARR